ncbi:glutamyl-tRNA(Gln) amidotransferase subunit C [Gammaproteobacteria bacterium]|nr:glutamyl-tRNA(Gln) amidotransferase subunit C [Gammaproteobacteria bacterium]
MSLTPEIIHNIATLSKLTILPEDMPKIQKDLNSILEIIEAMQMLDTAGIAPMAHPFDAQQRLRADVITQTNQREYYQTIAPAVAKGLYLVPKVIE